MPAVSTVVLTNDKTVTFTGTDFFSSGYTARVDLASVTATSVVTSSSSSIAATWDKGVPPSILAP